MPWLALGCCESLDLCESFPLRSPLCFWAADQNVHEDAPLGLGWDASPAWGLCSWLLISGGETSLLKYASNSSALPQVQLLRVQRDEALWDWGWSCLSPWGFTIALPFPLYQGSGVPSTETPNTEMPFTFWQDLQFALSVVGLICEGAQKNTRSGLFKDATLPKQKLYSDYSSL